jgi:hypothetical protein
MLPSRFQLGTGTTDILVAAFYQQRFGRWQPSVGLSYQFTGGENDIGYERSDRISWTVGTKFHLMDRPDCMQFYLYGGISGSDITSNDVDHSEDTTQLGSQEKGKVDGTKGTYNFYNLGVGYDITRNLTVSGGLTLPLDSQDDDSEYSFDRSYSLTLQLRF